MDKKHKLFITSICIIVAIIIVVLIVYIVTKNQEESASKNRLANMYERMIQNETYSITFQLNNQLNEIIQSQEPEKGQEKIDGKNYRYEEYKGVSDFLMNTDESISEENTNTRFYFDGDDLEYIKTIMEDTSELIRVDVSYDVSDNIFEIPSEFQEG